MSYIDLKFINEISTRLSQFKKKGDYLFNFRCPHCGDSKKSKTKARAYLYRVKNDMFFKCHNCNHGQNLANFLKFIDSKKYSQYLLERYKGSAPSTPKPKFDFKPPKFKETNILDDLTKVSELKEGHPVRKYVLKRKIPEKFFDKLFLCDKFMHLVNKVKPNTFPHTKGEHPRLIIPFYDIGENIFAFQGRAFGKEQPKYLTVKLDEGKQKVFGMERINLQEHIYIVEGPLDSLFLNNCLAAGGADLTLRVPPSQVTYIFDNEPRNKEIIKRMYDVVEEDYNIVVWPGEIQLKDVNDMIVSGMSKAEVQSIIHKNTFCKLEALTKLSYYKKC
jgi:transcription elongation factor Elf1|tara:strand:- start:15 stop:1010 length:996 start_codon:yes stop_codon:yes gene_type:complete